MIEVYGYVPAWDLPDISPYVTKLIFYLKIAKIPYEYKNQGLGTLDVDSPYGKLPYIIDTDNGTKVGDSNMIIEYLQDKYGDPLDKDLSPAEKAVELAFERLIGEHLYWSGVIEPRWRLDEGWEVYIPYIVGGAEVGKDLRKALDDFRVRVLNGFNGQGMGRRDHDTVLRMYKADVDAIEAQLGDKPYLIGEKPHTIDVAAHAMLRHLIDQPQKWPGTGYIEGKKKLMDYIMRFKEENKL